MKELIHPDLHVLPTLALSHVNLLKGVSSGVCYNKWKLYKTHTDSILFLYLHCAKNNIENRISGVNSDSRCVLGKRDWKRFITLKGSVRTAPSSPWKQGKSAWEEERPIKLTYALTPGREHARSARWFSIYLCEAAKNLRFRSQSNSHELRGPFL